MDYEVYRETLLEKNRQKTAFGSRHAGKGMAALFLAAALAVSGCGASGNKTPEPKDAIAKTAAYEKKTVERPGFGTLSGEWTVMGLARSEETVDDSYWEIYRTNLEKAVKETNGVLSERKYTEYSRVILALKALGENPQDVGGYDLTTPLEDFDAVVSQGLNGAMYALIALNADSDVDTDAQIKEPYLNYILEREKAEGGFSMDEEAEDAQADMTSMALQCLEPYEDRAEVKAVVDRCIDVLAGLQNTDGGYVSFDEDSSESVAQAILALSACGVDCNTDERFVKDGKGLYDALMAYGNKDGGFSHVKDGESEPMATDQALCAMVAYQRFKDGKNSFFDMSDHR